MPSQSLQVNTSNVCDVKFDPFSNNHLMSTDSDPPLLTYQTRYATLWFACRLLNLVMFQKHLFCYGDALYDFIFQVSPEISAGRGEQMASKLNAAIYMSSRHFSPVDTTP